MAPRLLKWFRKKCVAFGSRRGKDLTLSEGEIGILRTPNVDFPDRVHTTLSPGEVVLVPGMPVNFKTLVITMYPSGIIIHPRMNGTAEENEIRHQSQETDISAGVEAVPSILPVPATPENWTSVMKRYPSGAIPSRKKCETDTSTDMDTGRCSLLDSAPVTPDDSLTSVLKSNALGAIPSWKKSETDISTALDTGRCSLLDSVPVTPDNSLTSVMKRYPSGAIPSWKKSETEKNYRRHQYQKKYTYSDMNAVRRRLFDSPPVTPDNSLASVTKMPLSRAISSKKKCEIDINYRQRHQYQIKKTHGLDAVRKWFIRRIRKE